MQADEYQKQAMRTRNRYLSEKESLANAALGLAGESGELADAVKKYLFQGHSFDRMETLKELGDIMWYVALMCHTLQIPLSAVMQANINKLVARYPSGFSSEASLNREEYRNGNDATNLESLPSLPDSRPTPHRCS